MVLLQIVLYIILYILVTVQTDDEHFSVFGITATSCEQRDKGIQYSHGIPIFDSNEYKELDVYGRNITSDLQVGFTKDKNCNNVFPIHLQEEKHTDHHIALASFYTPDPKNGIFSQTLYYICTKYKFNNGGDWRLQDKIVFYVYEPFFTPEILLIIILLSYCLSSLMSGLNIGLFTLEPEALELLKDTGTAKQKKYAKKILPVLRRGNYLLCSILITATLCNAISTVTTNQFLSDWLAIILTTAIIVFLCEIVPQSICTTYPLFVGAHTIYLTRACMLLTAPISYPLGKILDWLFGKESLSNFNKERLQELLTLTQLVAQEEKIIAGTLNLSHKTVEEIMTLSNDMFKLPITAVLDYETIAAILASGFSRIPIYEKGSSNIQHILLTKELALLDPDDKVPVKVLVKDTKLKCHYVSKGTTVDKLLEIFQDSRSHMVFVVEGRDQGSVAEDRNVIGLVTFEDVIEEIFQMEINDETDNYSDNRQKRKLDSQNSLANILTKPTRAAKPSANLKLAVFSFLSRIDAFSDTHISPRVLRALLNLDIYYTSSGQRLPLDTIYVQGVPAGYFVMILEGEAEVKIGIEGLTFEAGAFRYFGLEALKLDGAYTFIPDFMLQAVRKTTYMKIDRVVYEAAILATQYERFKKSPDISVNSDLYNYYIQLID